MFALQTKWKRLRKDSSGNWGMFQMKDRAAIEGHVVHMFCVLIHNLEMWIILGNSVWKLLCPDYRTDFCEPDKLPGWHGDSGAETLPHFFTQPYQCSCAFPGWREYFKIGCLSSNQMKADRDNFVLETFVFIALCDIQKITDCGDLVVGTFLWSTHLLLLQLCPHHPPAGLNTLEPSREKRKSGCCVESLIRL